MNKPIVFLHPHFLKPGGASKVVLEQASGLISKGIDCVIVTTKINPEVTDPYKNLKIIQLSDLTTGNLFFWLTFPIFFFKLIRTINHINPKIIYCHSLAIYWGYFYKKTDHKIKLVYYLHDLGLPYTDLKVEIKSLNWFQKNFVGVISPILKTLNKNIFALADYIVANSKTSADYLFKIYKRKVDAIVWPGVDTNIFKPSKIKKDYVFTVGRLEKSKNIDKIIRGFSLYRQNNPKSKTKLLIVGEGVERNNLLKLTSEEKIEKYVDFLGRKDSKDISKIASQAKLGIFLGAYETFGIAVAESLACGTPVIGINVNGVKEIVSDKMVGKLVDGSSNSVFYALTNMLSQSKILYKMSFNAVTFAKQKLSWSIQIEKLYNFFVSI